MLSKLDWHESLQRSVEKDKQTTKHTNRGATGIDLQKCHVYFALPARCTANLC